MASISKAIQGLESRVKGLAFGAIEADKSSGYQHSEVEHRKFRGKFAVFSREIARNFAQNSACSCATDVPFGGSIFRARTKIQGTPPRHEFPAQNLTSKCPSWRRNVSIPVVDVRCFTFDPHGDMYLGDSINHVMKYRPTHPEKR